jgi:KDO2-lipid IV(A) lauroyltransferase
LILYYLLKLIRITAAGLPAYISYPIASAVGDFAYFLWPRGRRNMAKSIAAVLYQDVDSPEVKKNARAGLRNYYKSCVDIFRYAYPKRGFFERDIDLIGTENIDKELAKGKGVILVSLHMGNLDLGIRALSHAGYPINAIVQDFESGPIGRFVQRPRVRSGVKLISETESIFRISHVLRRNEAITLMIDGRCYEKGVAVKLGNKNVIVPGGMVALSLRTGAKIIPCGLIRSTNTKFHGIIGKPIQFEPTGNLVEDVRELTQRTIRVLQGAARIFADQWYIFHALIKDDVIPLDQVTRKNRGNKLINR